MAKVTKVATCESTYTVPSFIDGEFLLHACDGCVKVILPHYVNPTGVVRVFNRTNTDIIIENPTDSNEQCFLPPAKCIRFISSVASTRPLPKWNLIDILDYS